MEPDRPCSLAPAPSPALPLAANARKLISHEHAVEVAQTIAVVFAGGVGLGAYQGGAYAALHDREDLRPRWLAGSSVGAVNAALIAGNAPEHRVERLREFWAEGGPLGPATQPGACAAIPNWRHAFNWMSVIQSRLVGAPGYFRSRLPTMLFEPGRSLYDLAPMRERIERLVDFGRLNSGEIRLCVATTDIETGEPVLFDTGEGAPIGIDHLMASCGFLPEFAPVEIEGRLLGDGGLSMNAPIEAVLLRHEGDDDLLCIFLDLFARDGSRPSGLESALARRTTSFSPTRRICGSNSCSAMPSSARRLPHYLLSCLRTCRQVPT